MGTEGGDVLVPRPSLSLHPSQGVSLGDNVTLRCHLPRLAAWVWLYQEGRWSCVKYSDKKQDTTEFSFLSASQDQADRSLLPPHISLHPEERVGTGTNVTIRCWNKDYGAAFLLHKDGRSAPIQRLVPHDVATVSFTLFGVTPADSGTYRCSYRPKNYPFLSSPLGDSVTLEVTPTPAPPGAELVSRGNLVVAVVRGCAAVLIFALGIFFVIDARSLWIRRDESLGGEGI
ncbi:platelet glycoprotein VI-like isoform X1 [Gallus gallus]|uniref:platelet glycoprotein VI-like isoform X1 n=1 Tax=Gallus gallus TaxID=9031 RepID=UPI001F0049F7|nr:platelet glycoprotein VI-like isoform X1 [Gallus gallus]